AAWGFLARLPALPCSSRAVSWRAALPEGGSAWAWSTRSEGTSAATIAARAERTERFNSPFRRLTMTKPPCTGSAPPRMDGCHDGQGPAQFYAAFPPACGRRGLSARPDLGSSNQDGV